MANTRLRLGVDVRYVAAVLLGLLACACSDDAKTGTLEPRPEAEESAGGAPPSYPPALGPEDCATTTSKLALSQPLGAAVWGGLVVLDFTVDGAKVTNFDVQVYDPAIGAWSSSYVSQQVGQRDDGSYFIAVSPSYNAGNLDQELKVRVRPSQNGCPDADWTESESFTASDPITETSWKGSVPAPFFTGRFEVNRQQLLPAMSLPQTEVRLGDVTAELTFGKKGVFTETLTLPLVAAADDPFADCELVLTFTGTYSLLARKQYGSLTLAISEQKLTSFEGSSCELPAVDELALAGEDADLRLNAYTQPVSISYAPTLFAEPGAPLWDNNALAQVFQQLPQFFAYATADESGSAQGYVYPQELTLEKQ